MKSLIDVHECKSSEKITHANAKWIAKEIKDDLIDNPQDFEEYC